MNGSNDDPAALLSLTSLNTALPSTTKETPTSSNREAGACLEGLSVKASESDRLVHQIIDLCGDGNTAQTLTLIQQTDTLDKTGAEKVLQHLLSGSQICPQWPSLLVKLLTCQHEARQVVNSDAQHYAERLFSSALATTTDGVRTLLEVCLSKEAWVDEDARRTASLSILQRCFTHLQQQDDSPSLESVLGIIIRLVSSNGAKPLYTLDATSAETLLLLLDIRQSQAVQSQALLTLMRLTGDLSEQHVSLLRNSLLKKGCSTSRNDDIIAYSAAAALFPVLPNLCKELMLEKRVLHEVLACLKESAGMVSDDLAATLKMREAALMLLSAACIDKSCREMIKKEVSAKLETLLSDHDTRCSTLAALVTAKSGLASTDLKISKKIIPTISDGGADSVLALEALAYLSMSSEVKNYIIKTDVLLAKIIHIIRTGTEGLFSCMTILANLSAFKANQTKEQEKLAQLKAYAEATKVQASDALESDVAVQARCQKLIELNVVTTIVLCSKSVQNMSIYGLAARMLFALARVVKTRGKMAQEGAIGALLRIRELASRSQQSEASQSISTTAAHTIARILISVNPAHAFSGAVSPAAVVGAILKLLTPATVDGQRDWLPAFEGLLALTNMASVEDDHARQLIVTSSWSTIENDLLLSGNKLVQRACVELICNLMQSPITVAKFADKSEAGNRRCHILLVLTDVDDIPTRRGAGGALAMLTGWDGISDKILKQPKGLTLLSKLASDDDKDSRHRGLVCIMNIINAPGEAGQRAVTAFKASEGLDLLRKSRNSTTDEELKAMTQEIITALS